MSKHSRFEREKRAAETDRARQVEAEWTSSLSPDAARAFAETVAAARARGPLPPPPDMAPGTPPRPPRAGLEPKATKDERDSRRRRF
jgi:hypothetical protein